MNQTDQSQLSEDSKSKKFSYDPQLFQLLQKALLVVSKEKPQNPIKFVADYMKNNRPGSF